MTKDLTAGNPAKLILLFTLPLLIGNVFQQLYGLADAFVVGRTIGVDALAAVGCTGSLSFLMLGFAWGMTSGLAIPTAQAFGAGDFAAVRRSVATGALIAAVTTVVLTVVSVASARPMLELLNTPPEIIDDATTFITISFWGTIATMFFNFLASTIRALGDSKTPLVFLMLSCVLNIVLVYAFVAVLHMGVAGAALATVTSQLVSVILCLQLIRIKMPVLHLARDDWRVTKADVAQHLKLGLPMGFQASIIAIGALMLQFTLNGLGAESVAAYTAAGKVDGIAVAPLGSFGLAVSTFAAQNYGAMKLARIRKGVAQTCMMSVAFSVLIAAVNIIFGTVLIRAFIGDSEPAVVEMAHTYLILNGICYFSLGILFALRGALQGLGHALIPTLSGVMELVTRVGAALLLTPIFGFAGAAMANPLAWVGACALLIPAYLVQRRKLIRAEEEAGVLGEIEVAAEVEIVDEVGVVGVGVVDEVGAADPADSPELTPSLEPALA